MKFPIEPMVQEMWTGFVAMVVFVVLIIVLMEVEWKFSGLIIIACFLLGIGSCSYGVSSYENTYPETVKEYTVIIEFTDGSKKTYKDVTGRMTNYAGGGGCSGGFPYEFCLKQIDTNYKCFLLSSVRSKVSTKTGEHLTIHGYRVRPNSDGNWERY